MDWWAEMVIVEVKQNNLSECFKVQDLQGSCTRQTESNGTAPISPSSLEDAAKEKN